MSEECECLFGVIDIKISWMIGRAARRYEFGERGLREKLLFDRVVYLNGTRFECQSYFGGKSVDRFGGVLVCYECTRFLNLIFV